MLRLFLCAQNGLFANGGHACTSYPLLRKGCESMENSESQESWHDIPGYEGKYQVSDLGRVKSLNYKGYTDEEHLLKTRLLGTRGQYLSAELYDRNGKKHNRYVHVLVAQAFIPNPNGYPCVNHKDENKLNNCVSNLEWCTYKYNSNYGTAIERMRTNLKANPDAQRQIREIAADLRKRVRGVNPTTGAVLAFDSAADAGRYFGTDNAANIAASCHGRRKKAYGYIWEYTD